MGEIITIVSFLKNAPTLVTSALVILAVTLVVWFRFKDADISAATSISKAQNEKLMALMHQNDQLLHSVATLQEQVQTLHRQMTEDAEEHRFKMEQTYKIIDDMRSRIVELEDLVRKYQTNETHCTKANCARRQK